jgi:hypothetical protein
LITNQFKLFLFYILNKKHLRLRDLDYITKTHFELMQVLINIVQDGNSFYSFANNITMLLKIYTMDQKLNQSLILLLYQLLFKECHALYKKMNINLKGL